MTEMSSPQSPTASNRRSIPPYVLFPALALLNVLIFSILLFVFHIPSLDSMEIEISRHILTYSYYLSGGYGILGCVLTSLSIYYLLSRTRPLIGIPLVVFVFAPLMLSAAYPLYFVCGMLAII